MKINQWLKTVGDSLVFLGSAGAVEAITIDTTPGWSGGGYIFCSDCYYGQVFTVPETDSLLDSFTFFLSGSEFPIYFTGEVVPWDASTFRSGDILYKSELRNNIGFPGYTATPDGYAQVNFAPTGGLSLIPGEQYVAYLRTEPGAGSGAIGNNFDVDFYLEGYHLFA